MMTFLRITSVVVIAAVFVVASYRIVNPPEESLRFPDGDSISIWEWRTPSDFSTAEARELFQLLRDEGITTMYIDVSTYIDIFESQVPTRDGDLIRFTRALQGFLSLAREYGISVEALAGDALWGNASHRYIPRELLKYVLEFNKDAPPDERIRGMQFDIEYYNQKDFKLHRDAFSVEYLDTVENLITLASASTTGDAFKLGFAIPYWLGNSNGTMPEMVWHGKNALVYSHLVSILKTYTASYVVIMAYSDHEDGTGGMIQLATHELMTAGQEAPSVGVVVGMETKDVKPSKTTFFGSTRNSLKKVAQRVSMAFNEQPNFIGFAIHDVHGYFTLLK